MNRLDDMIQMSSEIVSERASRRQELAQGADA